MEQFLAFPLEDIPYLFVAVAFAFTIHEFAHAWIASIFGDNTAKLEGRLSLSPLAHLDIFGTLLIFVIGFGWARPVPVNRQNFKHPYVGSIFVSIAGPVSNLLLSCFGFLIWYGLMSIPFINLTNEIGDGLYHFLNLFIYLNIVLFVFNLLPFPPLDGYRVVEALAPSKLRRNLVRFEGYGTILLLAIIFTPLNTYTIDPIFLHIIPFFLTNLESLFSSILL